MKLKMIHWLEQGWEVEWAYYVERENGGKGPGIDPDTAKYRFRDFKTKAEAIAFAKSVAPLDVFGSVRVTPFHSEPYEPGLPATFKEYDGEAEYIEPEPTCPDCGGGFSDHNAVNRVPDGLIAHSRTGGACWKSLNSPFVDQLSKEIKP